MLTSTKVVDSDNIWACLITDDSYLPGLLTLAFSLRRVESKYPLVVLHTGSLPDETLNTLKARDISLQRIPFLFPGLSHPKASSNGHNTTNGHAPRTTTKEVTTTTTAATSDTPATAAAWYANDPRFRACFTKLAAFSLTAYARVVLLDADMLVRRNMDELFDVLLDDQNRVFAAVHACTCNPLGFGHYPADWVRRNCAFTVLEERMMLLREGCTGGGGGGGDGDEAVVGMGQLNGGLVVLRPDGAVYEAIVRFLGSDRATPENLPFADQSLLSELFRGRWVALPWVYNGLKTMRWERVHGRLWDDEKVKNVHYILTPKPWEMNEQDAARIDDGPDRWWWDVEWERRRWEAEIGLDRKAERQVTGKVTRQPLGQGGNQIRVARGEGSPG